MNDVGVIDRFTNVFSQYIDSGFGLLSGEVAFLTATLVTIDLVLAGLFWAMGGTDDIIAKLVKKTLYVGAFAFIINNFNTLANVLFRSFAGLGLTASGSTLTEAELLQPGRLASIGIDAGRPMLEIIGQLSGFPEVFANLDTVAVLFLAWLVVIVSFFVLSVQMFVALIEFKLTTLAGFVLVPFSLWNKTAFLAEKVLGNVVSSGIKILVLAVIVGIGGSVFGEFTQPAAGEFTSDEALAIMLASLAMLGLGIFGPGIAAGLVSGAPQLSAGAAAGTALAAGGLATAGVAGGAAAGRLAGSTARGGLAAATSIGRAAGTAATATGRAAGGAARAVGSAASTGARGAVQGAQALARGARRVAQTYQEGVEASGLSGIGGVAAGVEGLVHAGEAGLKNAAQSGLNSAGSGAQRLASAARAKLSSGFRTGFSGSSPSSSSASGSAGSLGSGSSASTPAGSNTVSESSASAPGWAQQLRDHGMSTGFKAAANVITSGDRPASGPSPTLTSNDQE
jgi:type IV secretion system protein TrbL